MTDEADTVAFVNLNVSILVTLSVPSAMDETVYVADALSKVIV